MYTSFCRSPYVKRLGANAQFLYNFYVSLFKFFTSSVAPTHPSPLIAVPDEDLAEFYTYFIWLLLEIMLTFPCLRLVFVTGLMSLIFCS